MTSVTDFSNLRRDQVNGYIYFHLTELFWTIWIISIVKNVAKFSAFKYLKEIYGSFLFIGMESVVFDPCLLFNSGNLFLFQF